MAYRHANGSWLNIANNKLSSLAVQCLHERRRGELAQLHREIAAWAIDVTDAQRGAHWQMKIDDARPGQNPSPFTRVSRDRTVS